MTFIEVHINEDRVVLEKLIRDAYAAIQGEALPGFRFGRVIVWEGRMFQQVELAAGPEALASEERFFQIWGLPQGRARIQVGSVRGEVFTTPPEAEGEPAARIKEGGRCAPESMVKPFRYSDYRRDD